MNTHYCIVREFHLDELKEVFFPFNSSSFTKIFSSAGRNSSTLRSCVQKDVSKLHKQTAYKILKIDTLTIRCQIMGAIFKIK